MNRKADDEVSKLIMITSMCRVFHCLPGPGGLLQQDPYLIDGMSYVVEAQAEREEKDQN